MSSLTQRIDDYFKADPSWDVATATAWKDLIEGPSERKIFKALRAGADLNAVNSRGVILAELTCVGLSPEGLERMARCFAMAPSTRQALAARAANLGDDGLAKRALEQGWGRFDADLEAKQLSQAAAPAPSGRRANKL
jgi:hypothetical protein